MRYLLLLLVLFTTNTFACTELTNDLWLHFIAKNSTIFVDYQGVEHYYYTNGNIYAMQRIPAGRITGNSIYDCSGTKVGYMNNYLVYDAHGSLLYSINGNNIYGNHGDLIATVRGSTIYSNTGEYYGEFK